MQPIDLSPVIQELIPFFQNIMIVLFWMIMVTMGIKWLGMVQYIFFDEWEEGPWPPKKKSELSDAIEAREQIIQKTKEIEEIARPFKQKFLSLF
jgi:hypothetical protein